MRTCEQCTEEIVYSGNGRPPTRFCSRKCKDAARHLERRAAKLAEAGERRCPVCDSVLPDTVTLKAVCCSRECGITHQNRIRAAAKLERLRELDRKCERCGESIPAERHGATKFCTTKCKQLAHAAVWRAKSPGYMRQYVYGITAEQFAKMLEDQGGACAICRRSDWPGRHNSPCVDHNHTTGAVRGLLCDSCNQGLGRFGDDPIKLRSAADYLERRS
jgi:hypothetical protein